MQESKLYLYLFCAGECKQLVFGAYSIFFRIISRLVRQIAEGQRHKNIKICTVSAFCTFSDRCYAARKKIGAYAPIAPPFSTTGMLLRIPLSDRIPAHDDTMMSSHEFLCRELLSDSKAGGEKNLSLRHGFAVPPPSSEGGLCRGI